MIREGIININKEQNMTSHDVVSRIRRIIRKKRVGHTGTLDPMATGVLPVCIGNATRIIEYLDLDLKKYRCRMQLGLSTDTYDIWGRTIVRSSPREVDRITEDDVRRVLKSFTGQIEQTPPMYSALKVNGKRLYEYAREGKTVAVKSRRVFIPELEIEDVRLGRGLGSTVTFSIQCTKGTYIRSVCHDAGELLGVHAVMSGLVRTNSGIWDLENARTLDELAAMSEAELNGVIGDPDKALTHFGEILLSEKDGARFANGQRIGESSLNILKAPEFGDKDFYIPVSEEYRNMYLVYSEADGREKVFRGTAILDRAKKSIKPKKVFVSGNGGF